MNKYIVLGASGGIGSETCRRLRADGSEVLLVGRSEERVSALAAELDSPFRIIDATAIDQVEGCIEHGLETMGQVDGIVNCVGSVLLKPAHLTTPAEWHETHRSESDLGLCSSPRLDTRQCGRRAVRSS